MVSSFIISKQTLRHRGGVCVVPNHGTTMIIRPLMTFLNKAWFVSWNTGRSRMNESIESNHSDQFYVQIEAMMQRHHIAVHDALCVMMLTEIIDERMVQVYLSSLMAFHAMWCDAMVDIYSLWSASGLWLQDSCQLFSIVREQTLVVDEYHSTVG